MIKLQEVSYFANERTILNHLTITLDKQLTAIIGANGSGKSTFARLLNGLIIPDQGTVVIDELDTKKQTKAVRQKVGFVFQNPDNQIVYPIVAEDLAFGLKKRGLTITEIDLKVDEILEQYQLTSLKKRYTHELSGGEKQLLAICGVLIMKPEYIIFDEPTTLLDLKNRNLIIQMIKKLPQKAIVVSHDLEMLQDFDEALCIDQGSIVFHGTPQLTINHYKQLMS